MLLAFNLLSGPPLHSLQYAHVSRVLGTLALDRALQEWPPQHWAEVKDPLPCPPGNAAQDTIHLPCPRGTLVAPGQPCVPQDPQGLLCRAAIQAGGGGDSPGPGALPLQDFALPLVELCEVPVSWRGQWDPFFVGVTLDGATGLLP